MTTKASNVFYKLLLSQLHLRFSLENSIIDIDSIFWLKFNRVSFPFRQWRIQDFPNGGVLFCHKWGAHILFSGKKCMKLKEIGLKWGGARLLVPCYSKITIFL